MKRFGSIAGGALGAAIVAACSGGPKYGRMSGDAYVALETGDQANVDARAVRILPDRESLDSALAVVCVHRERNLALAAGDSAKVAAASDSSFRERARLLTRRTLPIAVTAQPRGHFTVDRIAAGKYRVWADAVVNGGERWSWLEPVEVRGGDTTRVVLNNTNADEDPFRCQRRDLVRAGGGRW